MPLYLFHENPSQDEAYVRRIDSPEELTEYAISLRDRIVQLQTAPHSASELMREVRRKAPHSPTVERVLLNALRSGE